MTQLNSGETVQVVRPDDQFIYDGSGNLVGVGSRRANGRDMRPVQMNAAGTGLVDSLGNAISLGGGGVTATITGNLTFGSVLTATPPAGWAATGYQWLRDGVTISGATSSTYTVVEADLGAVLTCNVSGLSLAPTATVPVPQYPILASKLTALVGDSRTALNSEDANIADMFRHASYGYAPWLEQACDYRLNVDGNYGVNANTLDQIISRLGPTVQTRGQMLTVAPGLNDRVAFVLAGVNDTTSPIGTTGPKYDTLFMTLIDAGFSVMAGEIPNSNQSGQGAVHFARNTYIMGWPQSSPAYAGWTQAQKNLYTRRYRSIDTYNLMVDTAHISGTLYYPKAGYYKDLLHPTAYGNYLLGRLVGSELKKWAIAASYPKRNNPPTSDAAAIFGNALLVGTGGTLATETAGAGGSNMDGNGGVGVSNNGIATNWTVSRSTALRNALNDVQGTAGNQLSVTVSKGVDSDGFATQKFVLVGQVGGLTPLPTTYYSVAFQRQNFVTAASVQAAGIVVGDDIRFISRVKVAANPLGLTGVAHDAQLASTASTAAQTSNGVTRAQMATALAGTGVTTLDLMPAFDDAVMTPSRIADTAFVTIVETKNFVRTVSIVFGGGIPVNISVEISRAGWIKVS